MKNFATPLAIDGTKKELDELVTPLMELGYEKPDYASSAIGSYPYLVTNHAGWVGNLDYNSSSGRKEYPDRLVVPASNPELVLALAAMVEGKSFHKGEMIVRENWWQDDNSFTNGNLYKVKLDHTNSDNHVLVEIDDKGSVRNGLHENKFRKATVDEIINHFTIRYAPDYVPEYEVKKKPVGYKLIKEYPQSNKIGFFSIASYCKKYPEFWEPVYEQVFEVRHRNGKLKVEIKNNEVFCEEKCFSKKGIELILQPRNGLTPMTFSAGCNGQFTDIPREDIQKIYDALS